MFSAESIMEEFPAADEFTKRTELLEIMISRQVWFAFTVAFDVTFQMPLAVSAAQPG
jgi:hypothetical protein